MTESQTRYVDMIEELQMRTWARENYVAADQRDVSLHPVILEEMHRRDVELTASGQSTVATLVGIKHRRSHSARNTMSV